MTASSNQDGGLVQLQPCTYSDNQLWTFTSGTLRTFGNKCLDVTDGNPVDGTNLQIWTCSADNANQQFYYTVCLLPDDLSFNHVISRVTTDLPGLTEENVLTLRLETRLVGRR